MKDENQSPFENFQCVKLRPRASAYSSNNFNTLGSVQTLHTLQSKQSPITHTIGQNGVFQNSLSSISDGIKNDYSLHKNKNFQIEPITNLYKKYLQRDYSRDKSPRSTHSLYENENSKFQHEKYIRELTASPVCNSNFTNIKQEYKNNTMQEKSQIFSEMNKTNASSEINQLLKELYPLSEIQNENQAQLKEIRKSTNLLIKEYPPHSEFQYSNQAQIKEIGRSQNKANAGTEINQLLKEIYPFTELSNFQGAEKQSSLPQNLENSSFFENCAFLLNNEQQNIANYKMFVENEKSRIEKDFDLIFQDVKNILNDCKYQCIQSIDQNYKQLIDQYKQFKLEINEYNAIEKDITQQKQKLCNVEPSSQNYRLMRDMFQIQQNLEISKLYQLISDQQKEYHTKIGFIASDIIQTLSNPNQIYSSEKLAKIMNQVKEDLTKNTRFEEVMDQIIRPNEKTDTPVLLKQQQSINFQEQFFSHSPINAQVTPGSHNISISPFEPTKKHGKHTPNCFPVIQNFPDQQEVLRKTAGFYQSLVLEPPKLESIEITNENQSCIATSIPLSNIVQNNVFLTEHQDVVLCFTIHNNKLITGSQDTQIHIYNQSTNFLIASLQGHSGSVCSLLVTCYKNGNNKATYSHPLPLHANTLSGDYLISGSDHGDCSIILWDLNELVQTRQLRGHSAAVICLANLKNQNLVSGSYDKQIIIWNLQNGAILQKLQGHSSSIVCIKSYKVKIQRFNYYHNHHMQAHECLLNIRITYLMQSAPSSQKKCPLKLRKLMCNFYIQLSFIFYQAYQLYSFFRNICRFSCFLPYAEVIGEDHLLISDSLGRSRKGWPPRKQVLPLL